MQTILFNKNYFLPVCDTVLPILTTASIQISDTSRNININYNNSHRESSFQQLPDDRILT